MGLRLRRNISKSGRGLVLRIPADIVAALKLASDSEVWIWIEDKRMIVTPLETWDCSKCGRRNLETTKICEKCGAKMGEGV